jgi:predicted amidophosphoribosyltransferase
VARSLVGALKFRHLLPVAELMADRVHWLAPGHLLGGTVVPVPAAPPRLRRRGFDPAGELAAALAARLDAELAPCLARRGSGHQVGRGRADRIARPPRIEAIGEAPRSVLLVDDVLTTGATLTACAMTLRGAGAKRVFALTFTRRL